jgi:NAD(P)-dependent dehydrogenase (short-subunit alcohol dehydrogenase family)
MPPELWESRLKTDPLGKMSQPEDIAEMILFLAGAGGRFMTGQLITTRMRFG